MADILLKGTQYLNVPYSDFPAVGGGTARFWENVLKMGVVRNDAELVQTWSKDSMFVDDDGGTIPAYTTTATTILAASDLTPTYTVDYTNYNYYILVRALTIPTYNTSTKSAARPEYSMLTGCYEIVEFPANTIKTLDGSKSYGSRSGTTTAAGAAYRMLYWSSASKVSIYTSASYGIHQVIAAPATSSGVLTVKSPSLSIRGSSTYLSSTVWGTLTDIRVQYVVEAYRAPKGNLNLDGWGMYTQGTHILDCVNSTNHKLT